MLEEGTAEAALALSLQTNRDLGFSKIDNAIAISQNVLHQELGYFPKSPPRAAYEMSESTRDRLIAHARQDAAAALCHAIELRHQSDRIEKMMRNIIRILMIGGIAVLLALWHLGDVLLR
jgi:hypothetical protein